MKDDALVLVLVLGLVAIVGIVITPAITGAAWLKEVKSSILQPSILKENVKEAVKEADVEKTVEGFHKIIGYCVCSYEGHKYTCELNPYCNYGPRKGTVIPVTGGAIEKLLTEGSVVSTCNCKTPISTLAGRDVCLATPGCYFESVIPAFGAPTPEQPPTQPSENYTGLNYFVVGWFGVGNGKTSDVFVANLTPKESVKIIEALANGTECKYLYPLKEYENESDLKAALKTFNNETVFEKGTSFGLYCEFGNIGDVGDKYTILIGIKGYDSSGKSFKDTGTFYGTIQTM